MYQIITIDSERGHKLIMDRFRKKNISYINRSFLFIKWKSKKIDYLETEDEFRSRIIHEARELWTTKHYDLVKVIHEWNWDGDAVYNIIWVNGKFQ